MALVVEFETKPVAFFEISQLLSMSEGDLKRMKPPQQLGEEGEEEAEPSHQHHACIYATIQRGIAPILCQSDLVAAKSRMMTSRLAL